MILGPSCFVLGSGFQTPLACTVNYLKRGCLGKLFHTPGQDRCTVLCQIGSSEELSPLAPLCCTWSSVCILEIQFAVMADQEVPYGCGHMILLPTIIGIMFPSQTPWRNRLYNFPPQIIIVQFGHMFPVMINPPFAKSPSLNYLSVVHLGVARSMLWFTPPWKHNIICFWCPMKYAMLYPPKA